MTKFKSQERPGFSMTFENGWTISVQWHIHAYCERKKMTTDMDEIFDRKPAQSATAEIAIWDKEGEWYNFESDQVLGYQTPDQVVEWMQKVKNF